MTFKDKVHEYFKVGKSYRHYYGEIMVCTGFTKDTGCFGYRCLKHPLFGECDGSIKPTFKVRKSSRIFEQGHCAYCKDGTDWFTTLKSSNTRW